MSKLTSGSLFKLWPLLVNFDLSSSTVLRGRRINSRDGYVDQMINLDILYGHFI